MEPQCGIVSGGSRDIRTERLLLQQPRSTHGGDVYRTRPLTSEGPRLIASTTVKIPTPRPHGKPAQSERLAVQPGHLFISKLPSGS